ncbi:MAG: selenocysteine-specific translation elongation factor [Promethearchaeota archaeon]
MNSNLSQEDLSNKRKKKPKIDNITSYKSILLGLLGHVDSGKTSIARMISEIISTSGLDAHPQSKERGITIDLGFTSLILNDYLITLVDAPGHADLIRSVVASASIIDGAILVIDAKEGIQIQTAEHLVILESFQITDIMVILNKIDLVSKDHLNNLEKNIRQTLKSSKFGASFPIVRVSAKENIGELELKEAIIDFISKIEKKNLRGLKISSDKEDDEIFYPIDHYFTVKGKGVIVTGTTVKGNLKVGIELMAYPHKLPIRIKGLQIYYQDVQVAPRGFRVGANISGVSVEQLKRGDFFTNKPQLVEKTEIVKVILELNPYFKRSIKFGSQINITVGLNTYSGRIFPLYFDSDDGLYYRIEELYNLTQPQNKMVISIYRNSTNIEQIEAETSKLDNITSKTLKESRTKRFNLPTARFYAYIWFNEAIFLKKEMTLLLSKLDLPPTTLRFFGVADIIEFVSTNNPPTFDYIKVKKGKIKNPNYRKNQVLIEGFSNSKVGAEHLIGLKMDKPFDKIIGTFGNKGVVIANLAQSSSSVKAIKNLKEGMEIQLKIPRQQKIDKNKSY